MTIIEGQIEPLKKLKASLSGSGITRFNSIGEIRRFLRDFESEKKQLQSHIESVFHCRIMAALVIGCVTYSTYEKQALVYCVVVC